MKRLVIALTLIIATGCSSLAPLKPPRSPETTDSGQANVVVARNWNYIGVGSLNWLTFDGDNIVGMYTREFTKFTTLEGPHTIGVRWGSSLFGYAHMEKDINLVRNETSYFLISAGFFGADIEEVPERELVERISRYKFSSPGSTSKFHLY